jgi:hypothetical protein
VGFVEVGIRKAGKQEGRLWILEGFRVGVEG